ncbi:MaoC family dehydratase N-terminal domain-containing protein [Rhodococcus sp. NPDC057529]|uniref:FAS1-like dehydratase domain-containing protein n=1 Tax=Rhodococcus sp. NPDC057529 TaxID=3346158 RepID=UPI0036729144
MAGVEQFQDAGRFAQLLDTWSETRTAPCAVSLDSIRRFVQGAMITDDVYGNTDAAVVARFGGVVAPPLYPLNVFVRALGTPDPLDRLHDDPNWDAAGGVAAYDLPPIDTPLIKTLNGGTEARVVALAKVGDRISTQARYLDITPRDGKSGPLLIVRVEVRYFEQDGNDLLRTVRTLIRR